MAAEHGFDLIPTVALLGAAVVAVPIFKRLGLGSVLGYLAAGLVIGPFGLGLFPDPEAILHVAELGVVMFLFIIGLEMKPSRLWALRARDLRARRRAGPGLRRCCSPASASSAGLSPAVAFVAGAGFVAVLDGRSSCRCWRSAARPRARTARRSSRSCCSRTSPSCRCLALVAVLAPHRVDGAMRPRLVADRRSRSPRSPASVVAGRYLLNPLFRMLAAAAGARDHDRGGAAGGARRGAGHAARRPVDGDGRLPRRRAAVGIDLPPPARSRHRAVPRHPARPVLPRRRHVARPRGDRHATGR